MPSVDTCSLHLSDDEKSEVIPLHFAPALIACILLWILRVIIWSITAVNISSPSALVEPPKEPNYGYSSHIKLHSFLVGIGLSLCLPVVILFFIFQAHDDENSQDIACETGHGFSTSGYMGIFIALVSFMSVQMNAPWWKKKVSVKLASMCADRMRLYCQQKQLSTASPKKNGTRGQGSGSQKVVIAIIGVGRGVYVPPIVREAQRIFGEDNVEIICVDCFQSQYNEDTDEWFKFNMKREGVTKSISLLHCHYVPQLALKDKSVDIIISPIGDKLPYLRPLNATRDAVEEKMCSTAASFFQDITRILKPGGEFIASAFVLHSFRSAWDHGVKSAETLHLKPVTTPPKLSFSLRNVPLLWTAWIPSFLHVFQKQQQARDSSTGANLASNTLENGSTSSSSSSSSSYRFPMFDEMHEGAQITSLNDGSTEGVTLAASNAYTLLKKPHSVNTQEALAYFLIACMSILWSVCVYIVWSELEYLQVPSYLPYNTMLSSVFIDNLTSVPIALYYMAVRLLDASKMKIEDQMRFRARIAAASAAAISQNTTSPGKSFVDSSQHIIEVEAALETTRSVKRILKEFGRGMFELALLMKIVTVVSWLPFFSLDCILMRGFGYDVDKVGEANEYMNLAVIFGSALLVRPLIQLYTWVAQKRRKEDEEIELEHSKADAVATANIITTTTTASLSTPKKTSLTMSSGKDMNISRKSSRQVSPSIYSINEISDEHQSPFKDGSESSTKSIGPIGTIEGSVGNLSAASNPLHDEV